VTPSLKRGCGEHRAPLFRPTLLVRLMPGNPAPYYWKSKISNWTLRPERTVPELRIQPVRFVRGLPSSRAHEPRSEARERRRRMWRERIAGGWGARGTMLPFSRSSTHSNHNSMGLDREGHGSSMGPGQSKLTLPYDWHPRQK